MAIARFEKITVNNLTFGQSDFGEQSTTQTKWFDTRARVHSVANSLKIADKYRLYQDLVNFTLNYTPNTRTMVNSQNLYSITWRGNDWRIDNIRESDDRMNVNILCYRTDPVTAV
ncbi:hypothetical protein UFOVP164_51 [uncultured Caudovirales phage]|uniref:Bacteriophage SPP1, head-tail adaptor n=1 Tax=uncultured Caudovirales phage TaxID=2100421 RepID=A0A6J7XP22_9CAUD|nr:hypothetical protein UFOVP164_51 [uncultured Caudovirales phage]